MNTIIITQLIIIIASQLISNEYSSLRAITVYIFRPNLNFGLFVPGFGFKSLFWFGPLSGSYLSAVYNSASNYGEGPSFGLHQNFCQMLAFCKYFIKKKDVSSNYLNHCQSVNNAQENIRTIGNLQRQL